MHKNTTAPVWFGPFDDVPSPQGAQTKRPNSLVAVTRLNRKIEFADRDGNADMFIGICMENIGQNYGSEIIVIHQNHLTYQYFLLNI